jgi:hypothetical protein
LDVLMTKRGGEGQGTFVLGARTFLWSLDGGHPMITLLVLTAIYFLPTLVAAHRGHSVAGILLLNVFFGWTGIGWAALLLWALLSRPPCWVVPPGYYRHPGWR